MKKTKTAEAVSVVEAMTAVEVRKRTRGDVDVAKVVADTLKGVTPEIEALAKTVFFENKKLNEAKRNHDGARKNLYEYMRENKIAPFDFVAKDGMGESVTITSYVSTPEAAYIDVELLHELVKDKKTLMKILSATKAAVVEHVGNIIATKATRVGKGTENVFVKEVKEGK